MQPAKLDLNIVQGSTLRDTLRIMSPRVAYRTITAIAATAPVRLTVDHGLPSDWLAWIQGVQLMPELNRALRREQPHRIEVIDAMTLEINALSAVGRNASGGQLIYQQPVDLTGATARMQIRDKPGGLLRLELSTEGGGLVITGAGTLERHLSATTTAAITWTDGVYDLEVTYADGTVHRYFEGAVTVSPEVTRDD